MFARVLKASATNVTVSFTADESESDVLTWDDIQPLTDEMHQMLSTTSGLQALVVNPFDRFWQGLLQCINDEVSIFLNTHGAGIISKGTTDNCTLLDLPVLIKGRNALREYAAAPQASLARIKAVKAELKKR